MCRCLVERAGGQRLSFPPKRPDAGCFSLFTAVEFDLTAALRPTLKVRRLPISSGDIPVATAARFQGFFYGLWEVCDSSFARLDEFRLVLWTSRHHKSCNGVHLERLDVLPPL